MSYRAVVRHVRYWRGQVHRWSTVYHFEGEPSTPIDTAACQTMLTWDDAMCYGGSASEGGTYACEIYDKSTGGVPIASYVRFDWETPGSWIKHAGSAWTSAQGPMASPAETALYVTFRAGKSKTGKGVELKKWFHAVPESSASGSGADVVAADQTSLLAHASTAPGVLGAYGLTYGSGTGRFAGAASVSLYYANHQMQKGKRLTVKQLKARTDRALKGPFPSLD